MLLLPYAGWPQELARIYVYAPREMRARSWLLMLCDGTVVAKIKRGTFFAINVTAGGHILSARNGVPSFVAVGAGDESFVRLDWQIEIGEQPTLVFDNVPAGVARNEMRFVVYIDSKQVMSSSVSKTDPRPTPELHLKRRDDQLSMSQ
ncbi:MAG: hypothetical protein ACR2JB_03065 [Bryobacteraceae bacterium]